MLKCPEVIQTSGRFYNVLPAFYFLRFCCEDVKSSDEQSICVRIAIKERKNSYLHGEGVVIQYFCIEAVYRLKQK